MLIPISKILERRFLVPVIKKKYARPNNRYKCVYVLQSLPVVIRQQVIKRKWEEIGLIILELKQTNVTRIRDLYLVLQILGLPYRYQGERPINKRVEGYVNHHRCTESKLVGQMSLRVPRKTHYKTKDCFPYPCINSSKKTSHGESKEKTDSVTTVPDLDFTHIT